jgi:hypothetical protein
VKGIHQGGERCADLALGVAHHVALPLPWTASASEAEIGSPDGSGDSCRSARHCDGGALLGGSGDEGH